MAGGAWPLLHRRSFERVFGPKADKWLQCTVAGLLVANGFTQIRASRTREGARHAALAGVGTAVTLLAVDLGAANHR